jgi:hypothetical protein
VRPVCVQQYAPKCPWLLPKERMTVITSEVPVQSNEILKSADGMKIATSHLKNIQVKKPMCAINSKYNQSFRAGTLDKLLFYYRYRKLFLSQIVRTPNVQVKHGLQIFNICFVSNNSTVKSKSYCCSPKERSHREEMCAIALSITEKSFGWISASTQNFSKSHRKKISNELHPKKLAALDSKKPTQPC